MPAISSEISHVAGFRLATLASTQPHAVVNTNLQKRFYTTFWLVESPGVDSIITRKVRRLMSVNKISTNVARSYQSTEIPLKPEEKDPSGIRMNVNL